MLRIYLFAGVVPALLLLGYIYRLDRVEKEPIDLLVKLFFMGGLTTFFAMILESIGMYILGSLPITNRLLFEALEFIVVVGGSEEFVKRFALERYSWTHPRFNYRFDGVVYSVAVAAGFAAFENVMYLFQFGLQLAPMRAMLAIPMHVICGIFMGHYYGEAKRACDMNNDARRRSFRVLSLVVPALLHGIYDLCAATQSTELAGWFFVYVVIVDIAAFICVRRFAAEDAPA